MWTTGNNGASTKTKQRRAQKRRNYWEKVSPKWRREERLWGGSSAGVLKEFRKIIGSVKQELISQMSDLRNWPCLSHLKISLLLLWNRYLTPQEVIRHMYSEQYAPNIDDTKCFPSDWSIIRLSLGRCCNFCLDNILDRSSTKPLSLSKAAKSITALMKGLDVWRQEQLLYCVLDVEYLPR